MKIEEFTLFNVSTNGDGEKTPSTRLTPNALPERGNSYAVVESSTGVSTRYARFKKALEQETVPQWYVLGNDKIEIASSSINSKNLYTRYCVEINSKTVTTLSFLSFNKKKE